MVARNPLKRNQLRHKNAKQEDTKIQQKLKHDIWISFLLFCFFFFFKEQLTQTADITVPGTRHFVFSVKLPINPI